MSPQLNPTPAAPSLDRLFAPKSIALVGAKDRSIWSVAAFDNLKRFGFPGRSTWSIRTAASSTARTLPSCAAVGEPIDAALLMVPQAALPETIADLGAAGVGGAVILSAGFAETGTEGAERQAATAIAREAGIRLIGPNCLGFANHRKSPLWTTPLRRPMPDPTLAVVSQSGAVASQMEQFAYQQRIALTHLISTGNEADITIADAIGYLAGCEPRHRPVPRNRARSGTLRRGGAPAPRRASRSWCSRSVRARQRPPQRRPIPARWSATIVCSTRSAASWA